MTHLKYDSFESADESNYELLQKMFGESKTFKLLRANKPKAVFDGLLSTTKDGKSLLILCEVKCRSFKYETLKNEFHNTLFLEKKKYTNLHKMAKAYASPGREVKIWYISKTEDDIVFIHDITDADYSWIMSDMNKTTYGDNKKVGKLVALLHTSAAIFSKKLKPINE